MVRDFVETGYWAVILGGSSGLGLASALKLASHGMNICIVHRNSRAEMLEIEKNFDLIRSLRVELLTFNADVIKNETLQIVQKTLTDKLGDKAKIRCLVHSIAKGNLKAMVKSGNSVLENSVLESEDFLLTLQNMAVSLSNWTKYLFDASLFAEDARIISFTSEGSSKAWKHYAAVSAAKAALEAITRNIALEYAPYGIRANCIQAGVTDTASLRRIPDSEKLIQHSVIRNPYKRLTTPENVADVVYLLCKDEAAWINGAIIPVDGGEHIN